ncbi:MAG: UDP-3-O-(3-hydroxymyristoyl)glucosamine N-acyltransferase, partial [Candidatus Cloacimonadota bacterium]|nr:UDP-3-O-(3-hydroxymyristoyl)glucosamine N-acyltransferase [Candidatus Cloacimonadota bacterium]
MKQFDVKINLDLISSQISGNLQKINNNNFDNVSELNSANSHSVCFYENSKYFDQLINSKAGLIFVKQDFDKPKDLNTNLIFVEHPYIYFMMLVKKWIELDSKETKPVISQSAVIHPTAKLGTNVNISPNSVIEKNVIIGDNTTIGANSVVMHDAKIGAECKIFPNVTIYHECEIKNRVILHSGVVIGADGFGFLLHEGIQQKIPQVGNVVIESDVEIGANSCVDRSTLGTTIIG